MCSVVSKFFNKLLGGSTKTTQVQPKGIELVPSTESKEVEAADLGGANKRNKRQKKSLTIDRNDSSGGAGGLNI